MSRLWVCGSETQTDSELNYFYSLFESVRSLNPSQYTEKIKVKSESDVSTHLPEFDVFSRAAVDVELVPVYRRLVSDSLTPVSAFRKIDRGSCSCLFESVIGGERVGRYSFLATDPYMTLEAFQDRVTVNSATGSETFVAEDPLAELEKRVSAVRAASFADLPPFSSGAVGYAGYDVVRYTENLPGAPEDDRELPDLSFAFYDQMVVFDHITKTIIVVAMAHLDCGTIQEAYRDACDRIDALVARLSTAGSPLEIEDISTAQDYEIDYVSNFLKHDFELAVEKCVNYIRAGDIFQVVLSQRLEMPIASHPFEIYRTLRVVNPSPFMFYLKSPDAILVGSSPEVMVRVEDGLVTVRPLAGTRQRGATEAEDHALADELLADPKERAEHVMLVDLGRNDIGRVARFRSVALSDTMTIERYSHVMHITSNVTGQLEAGKNAFDALRACLPAGTVSGAPKVRAMEIIDELEPHRRGPYAGAIGYADFNGNMDTCIALRTLVIKKNRAYVQAGAGIVADSIPENEYQETLNKARGLLKAIAITEQRHAAPKLS
tara:strand:- start:52 stop:1695 length:1644 start_codon:yes stop_codon:yes gene_type:complete